MVTRPSQRRALHRSHAGHAFSETHPQPLIAPLLEAPLMGYSQAVAAPTGAISKTSDFLEGQAPARPSRPVEKRHGRAVARPSKPLPTRALGCSGSPRPPGEGPQKVFAPAFPVRGKRARRPAVDGYHCNSATALSRGLSPLFRCHPERRRAEDFRSAWHFCRAEVEGPLI